MEQNPLYEFAVMPGNLWILSVFVLVLLDLATKNRMYLTMVAVASFLAAFLARLFLPVAGQVAVFIVTATLLLWKGRKPIMHWRSRTLEEERKALLYARSLDAVVVEAIPGSTMAGRILVDGQTIMDARARKPIAEGTPVQITSTSGRQAWVTPKIQRR